MTCGLSCAAEEIRVDEKTGATTTTKADPYGMTNKRTSNSSGSGNDNGRNSKLTRARAMLRSGKLVEGFSTFRWIDCVSGVGYRRFSVLLHNFPTIKY
jgi:hypothetical protein